MLGFRISYQSDLYEPYEFNVEPDCFEITQCLVWLERAGEFLPFLTIHVAMPKYVKELINKCTCDTLKEYVQHRYKLLSNFEDFSFINDNQTTLGKNYIAWQLEYSSIIESVPQKNLEVMTKSNDTFYEISYGPHPDAEYQSGLAEFKKIANSIQIFPLEKIAKKVPSFLNATEIAEIEANESNRILTLTPDELFKETLKEVNNGTVESAFGMDQTSNGNTLQIMSHNSFMDSIENMHVVGEVKNASPTIAEFVKVVATFYDVNNSVVATDFTYTNPSAIPAGNTAPFELIVSSASIPVEQIDSYKLDVSYE